MKVIYSDKDNKWITNNALVKKTTGNDFDIAVNSSVTYQSMLGFGGAFTDATVENYLLLDDEEKERFVKAYFSKSGLGYKLGRYPIHSTDFSSYSYDYLDGTKDLTSINIEKDRNKINLVNKCDKTAHGLDIMMSVWSPFSWMKSNQSLYQGGQLLYDFYKPWATYLSNVAVLLINEDINITMITSQNEPEAKQTWESCIYTAKEEGRFVNELYAALKKNEIDDIGIYLVDHNRDLLPHRVIETMKYVNVPIAGVAYHWYDHKCFNNLTKMHDFSPEFHLLMSECCIEIMAIKESFGLLSHAEKYAHEMISDFNNYSEGWIDWNLMLNEIGGPNHVGNYCESPIMMNRKTKKMTPLPSYYYIGHFSKYVDVGSYRIETINTTKLDVVSFLTSNNKIVVIVLNKNDDDIETSFLLDDEIYKIKAKAHSIMTIIK